MKQREWKDARSKGRAAAGAALVPRAATGGPANNHRIAASRLLLAGILGAQALALALDVSGLALGLQRGGVLEHALGGVLAAIEQNVFHVAQQLLVQLGVVVGDDLQIRGARLYGPDLENEQALSMQLADTPGDQSGCQCNPSGSRMQASCLPGSSKGCSARKYPIYFWETT